MKKKKFVSDKELIAKELEYKKKQKIKEDIDEKKKVKAEEDISESTKILNEARNAEFKVEFMGESFKKDLRKSLLSEALYSIYSKSVPVIVTESLDDKGVRIEGIQRQIIDNFINENGGANKIVRDFYHKNILLAEYAGMIDGAYNEACKGCVKKDNGFTLPGDVKDTFFDNLAKSSPEDVIGSIKDRVAGAINSFLSENEAMKASIKDVCVKAAEKEEQNPDASDTVKESYQIRAKQEIGERKTRPISLLGEMVRLTAKSIIKDPVIREEYTGEDNKLDMESIVESATLMYTFLEMVNTLDLVKITPEYIQEQLNKI